MVHRSNLFQDLTVYLTSIINRGYFRSNFRPNRWYFRFACTAEYRFWAYLIWARKLGKPVGKIFVKLNLDISCKYFSYLAFQKIVQLICETLDKFNRSFDSFYSQVVLALQTNRPTNPRVKHQNDIIEAGKIIWANIFLE